VTRSGTSRQQIARTLTTAYAGRLLSEDTFARRFDQLFDARVIEPRWLVGDLSLRAPLAARPWRLLRSAIEALARVRVSITAAVEERPEVLLALDWRGADRELLVGRNTACDVVLPDQSVSRLHARLVFRDGSWIVQDLASTNGTLVNGRRVGRCELRPGDVLLLGNELLKVD
jgi:hypothetical protein